jgi:hypothetical protein
MHARQRARLLCREVTMGGNQAGGYWCRALYTDRATRKVQSVRVDAGDIKEALEKVLRQLPFPTEAFPWRQSPRSRSGDAEHKRVLRRRP